MNLFFRQYKKRKIGDKSIFLRRNSIDFEVYDYVFNEKYHRSYKKLLSSAPVILDLGANIGLTIVDFKREYPNAKIFAFEMDKDNFKIALKNSKDLKDVYLFNKAVWFENTRFTYSKKGNQDAYKLDDKIIKDSNSVVVDTISVAQILEDQGLSHVDYVKMDIEGAEYQIFQNDLRWLEKVREIKIEVHYGEEIFEFIRQKLGEFGFVTVKDTHHWSTIIAYRQ